jgi:transcriptional regulator with XRE-family HTH domain
VPEELSDRIRATMERQGFTQVVLARRLGVTQGALCKYLQGSEPRGKRYLELWRKLDDIDGEGPAGSLVTAGGPTPDAPAAAEEPPERPTGMFAWLRGAR